MNETIYDLIDAIKEDKRYLQFKEQSLKLLNQETKELYWFDTEKTRIKWSKKKNVTKWKHSKILSKLL